MADPIAAPGREEPRGPHVPDELRRLSAVQWAFIALAAFHGITGISRLLVANPLAAPWQLASWSGGLIADVAFLLGPVALLARAPDAARRMPLVFAGVVVLALQPFARWVSGWLTVGIADPDDMAGTLFGWSVVSLVLQAGALLGIALVAAGTWSALARLRPTVDRTLGAIAVAVVAPTLGSMAYAVGWIRSASSGDGMALVLAVVGGAVAAGWGTLGWLALRARGWSTDSRAGWSWLAVAGLLHVIGALAMALFSFVVSTAELGQVVLVALGIIGPAAALAFLAALALGVPRPVGADDL